MLMPYAPAMLPADWVSGAVAPQALYVRICLLA